jgi:uncharacterized protein
MIKNTFFKGTYKMYMNDYSLTPELYLIPNAGDRNILYFPLSGLLIEANDTLLNLIYHFSDKEPDQLNEEELEQFSYLLEKGLISKKGNPHQLFPETGDDVPHKLTLFPTNDCNLSCTYCYASGSRSKRLVMSLALVEAAVEYYLNLMRNENRSVFNLELHGGGEPLYEWDLVQKMIGYIEEKCIGNDFILKAVSSTNGILKESQLEWITEHFSFLVVSFEGLPEIQNLQRPFPNGKQSFDTVDRTIRYLDKKNFNYGIRVTVTHQNEDLLKETLDFISENYKTRLIFFEPVNICGNSHSYKTISLSKFAGNFILLDKYAEGKGIKIMYSGADHEKRASNFCYVGTSQFAITPEGYLTNCWEVTDMEHPLSATFIFGKLSENGLLGIDEKKYNYLRTLSVRNIEYCRNCFAKWHCAGDCLARLYNNGNEISRNNERCSTNRQLIAYRLIQMLESE